MGFLNKKAKQRNFTLIEMLVIIAVIMILAALLFPTFGKINAMAKGTSCGSKMRDIRLIMGTYISDCGWFPYCGSDYTTTYNYSGIQGPLYLGGYIPKEKVVSSLITTKSPYSCPSSDPPSFINYQYSMYLGFIGNIGSASSWWRYNPGVKFVNQKFPGKTSMLIEKETGAFYREVWDNNKTTLIGGRVTNYLVGMRHNGKANVIYVDGHLGKISEVPMMQRDDPFFNRLY